MMATLQEHLDKILHVYTKGDHFDRLIDAKKKYFDLTGTVTEEHDDYEARMNCFNEWYVFHYLSRGLKSTIVIDYLERFPVDPDVDRALRRVCHSLFDVKAVSSKETILHDVIYRKKIVLRNEEASIGCVQNDLFSGRRVMFRGSYYLLNGLCIYPLGSKDIVVKEAVRVSRFKDPNIEMNFLFHLEALKTKWKRYGHIGVEKIFTFN